LVVFVTVGVITAASASGSQTLRFKDRL
jgi:hypothetical protein